MDSWSGPASRKLACTPFCHSDRVQEIGEAAPTTTQPTSSCVPSRRQYLTPWLMTSSGVLYTTRRLQAATQPKFAFIDEFSCLLWRLRTFPGSPASPYL